jgi:hypothetical protein
MEMSGQLHAPAALTPGKEYLVAIVQEAGWAPEQFLKRGLGEKFPAPAGNRTADHSARSPALYRWAIPAPGHADTIELKFKCHFELYI